MNAGRSPSRSGQTRKCQWYQTVSAQPHPASSQRFLNDPLERQKVLVLGEKHSPAHASVEHVENHPPRRNIALDVTFTAFYRNIPALSILVAVTFRGPRKQARRRQTLNASGLRDNRVPFVSEVEQGRTGLVGATEIISVWSPARGPWVRWVGPRRPGFERRKT